MNKSELMQSLESKYYRAFLLATPVTTYENNLKRYLVFVFDKDGDVIRKREVHFYVENEGEADEVAHWDEKEPKVTPSITFSDEVNDYIKGVIDTEQIEGAFIENIDSVNETAIARIVMNDLTEQRRFIDKDASGDLRHRVVG